ncbi:MAG: arylsulfatase, partial [Verrucomicrobia bacterium]|nr:arylsulfatase [Verrucomicrobiota bacterium]
QLQAVSSGPWKLLLPHTYRTLGGQPPGRDGQPAKYVQRKVERPELYDLDTDIGETRDVASEHPEVVRRIDALAERARADLGDALVQRVGAGVREPGRGGPASGR